MINISQVVKKNLCTNCGTCLSVCPHKAISYKTTGNNFQINVNGHCKKCGLCCQVCPGLGVDFKKIDQNIFGNDKSVKYDPNLGYFKKCYLAFSKNKLLRFKCSSGGAVTTTLLYLLKNKIIDGALITTMDPKHPLITKPFIAYTAKDIITARGSKYSPVLLNQCLRKIINSPKNKFAVVGLPCHIHGLRKYQQLNPILKQKIFITLGLMCGQGVNLSGTKYILKQLKTKECEVKTLFFRGNGWPGNMGTITKKNQIRKIPFMDTFKIFTLGFFTPPRCFLCTDLTNELADISFSDAWLLNHIKNDKNGTNFIISRTRLGQTILSKLKNDLFLSLTDQRIFINSNKIRLMFKKHSIKIISKLSKTFKIDIPQYNFDPKKNKDQKNSPCSFLIIFPYLNSTLSNKFPGFFLSIPIILWNLPLTIYKKFLNFYKEHFLNTSK
jgi:coenzyme F420 hydrogenase subunit beta